MSDYVPEDIQVEILKHLPVETLMQFRRVCKWWKQTIDSQPFIVEFEEEAQFLVADPYKLPSFNTLFIIPNNHPNRPERLHVVSTVHGIVCLYNQYCDEFLLWNPNIPKLLAIEIGVDFDWTGGRFDIEYTIGYCAGFWIDPRTRDFKIVVFHLFDDKEEGDVYGLYSSIKQDWEEIPLAKELELYYTISDEVTPPVVMDGVGYWAAYYNYFDRDEGSRMFDFVKETFDTMDAFSVDSGWNLPVLCCNGDGVLSMVYMTPGKECDVFLRKGGSWVHAFGMELLLDVNRVLWGMEGKVVVATPSGELLLFDNETMTYTRLKKSERRLKEEDEDDDDEVSNDVCIVANGYVESLLFP